MRLLHILILMLWVLIPTRLYAFVVPVQVQVEREGWGDANLKDVQAVLDSVIVSIAPYIENHKPSTVIVRNSPDGPKSLYDKGENGEYIVLVNVKGSYWSQLVYQFSHEMCHVMSNYDLAPNNVSRQQWFEESLCEAFSLFALERTAQSWKENPPYPNWKDYAPHFIEYQRNQIAQAYRKLPEGMKFPKWYQQYRKILSDDPYAQGRDLDELVSNHLLPVFAANPDGWRAINYLNLGEKGKAKSLNKYLSEWEDNAPSDLRAPVEKIRQMILQPDP
jgi:hypothetical protein